MNDFNNALDGFADDAKFLAKDELKELVSNAKNDKSEFVRIQAENLERWTIMLADGKLTTNGYKNLVMKMEVLTKLEAIKLKVAAKASAQRLAEGIQKLVIERLFALI